MVTKNLWPSADQEKRPIPDNYILRGLLGVIVPGQTADLQIVMVMAAGHDKGLLAYEKSFCFGWAIRNAGFTSHLECPTITRMKRTMARLELPLTVHPIKEAALN